MREKENIQLQDTLAIISHLGEREKKTRNTCEIHSLEAH